MNSRFRLCGKHLFLTYPKCNLSKEDLHVAIVARINLLNRQVRKYAIGQETHEDGELHLHCYLELDERTDLRAADCLDVQGFHGNYQTCRSPKSCASYVVKDGDYIANFDVAKEADSKSSKRAKIGKKIIDGARLDDLVVEHPELVFGYCRLKQDINAFKLDRLPKVDHATTRGLWIWGPPGSGKSRLARSEVGSIFIKPQSRWWTDYLGEEIVILDDLDDKCLGHYLKIWADHYACTGETKGGHVALVYKKFIVTSNFHPEDLWNETEREKRICEAICRRFTFIHKI